jgi:hypothetical protein
MPWCPLRRSVLRVIALRCVAVALVEMAMAWVAESSITFRSTTSPGPAPSVMSMPIGAFLTTLRSSVTWWLP